MAIAQALDRTIIDQGSDLRSVLSELVAEHGSETVLRDARIVFGSWRTRIDTVEATLTDILSAQGSTAPAV